MVKIKIQRELGLTLVFAIATKLLLILQTFAGLLRLPPASGGHTIKTIGAK